MSDKPEIDQAFMHLQNFLDGHLVPFIQTSSPRERARAVAALWQLVAEEASDKTLTHMELIDNPSIRRTLYGLAGMISAQTWVDYSTLQSILRDAKS